MVASKPHEDSQSTLKISKGIMSKEKINEKQTRNNQEMELYHE